MRCRLRYDDSGNVIQTHEHAGEFKEPVSKAKKKPPRVLFANY
jgi:hypothetical protein